MSILANSDDLTTDVRSLINEETASFWTDAFILRQLKKAHQICSTKLKLIPTIWEVDLVAGSPSAGEAQIVNDREIRLSSSFLSIDDGGVYYNDEALVPSSISEIKSGDDEWLDEEGTPDRYYLRGDYLGFDKQISAGDTVIVYHIKMPTEIASGQAPFDDDYRTVGYRYLLVDYAVGMCWKAKNEMSKFAFYLAPKVGSFWQGIEEMKEELYHDGDGGIKIIPAENLAHYSIEGKWPDWSKFSH